MKKLKMLISMMLVLALAFTAASCGSGKGKLSAEESANLEKLENAEVFYVMVGTDFDKNLIRLRRFEGVNDDNNAAWCTITRYDGEQMITNKYKGWSNITATWWEHDPNDYSYGDIFLANGIEPEIWEIPYYTGTVKDQLFGSEVKLEKLGNCKDLLTLKKLEIEEAEYDGYGVWSIRMNDPESKNDYGYYFGFRNDASFGHNLEGSKAGDTYRFAFIGDIPVIPVEEKS